MKLLKLLAIAPLVLLSTDVFAQSRRDGGRDRGSYSSRDHRGGRYESRGRYDNRNYYRAPRSYSYSYYAPRYSAYGPYGYAYDPYYYDTYYYPSTYYRPYVYRPRLSIGLSFGRSHRRR